MSASTAKTTATIAPTTSGSFDSGHGVRRLTANVTPSVTAIAGAVEVVQLVRRRDGPSR